MMYDQSVHYRTTCFFFLRVGDAIERKIRIFVAPHGKLEPSCCAQPYAFVYHYLRCSDTVAYPGIFFGGGVQQIQLRTENRGQRERGSGGGSPLVRGSGGSCKLVQEISFHMVTFSSFFVL